MKFFLFKIISFLFTIIILVIPFEIAIFFSKDFLFSENNLNEIFSTDANNYYWLNNIQADSLIILGGSSTVRNGLSCNVLNEITSNNFKHANIAYNARDPIQTYFIIKNLNIKIHTIFFALDQWIFSKRYYKHRNSYMYLDFNLFEIILYSIEHDNRAFLKRYFNFLSIIKNKKEDKKHKIPNDFGSVSIEKNPINFHNDIDNWFQIEKYGWSTLQFTYLKKIEKLCEEKNIILELFITPKRSDLAHNYSSKFVKIHGEYISRLGDLNMNIPIFGKFFLPNKIDNKYHFVDAVHLNADGQKKFSNIFYELRQEKKGKLSHLSDWFNFDE